MPGEVKNKKLDKTSRSTWARLESAGRGPAAGKPFAAERMDQRDVDPADLLGEGSRDPMLPPLEALIPPRARARARAAPRESPAGLRRALMLVERRYSLWISLPATPNGEVVGRAVSQLEGFADVTAVHIDVDGIRVTIRSDATPEEVERQRKVVQGRLSSRIQVHLPTYPPDHVPFMGVARGGSKCANCKYVSDDLAHCASPNFQAYYGTREIPFPPGHDASSSCSDWWEPK